MHMPADPCSDPLRNAQHTSAPTASAARSAATHISAPTARSGTAAARLRASGKLRTRPNRLAHVPNRACMFTRTDDVCVGNGNSGTVDDGYCGADCDPTYGDCDSSNVAGTSTTTSAASTSTPVNGPPPIPGPAGGTTSSTTTTGYPQMTMPAPGGPGAPFPGSGQNGTYPNNSTMTTPTASMYHPTTFTGYPPASSPSHEVGGDGLRYGNLAPGQFGPTKKVGTFHSASGEMCWVYEAVRRVS